MANQERHIADKAKRDTKARPRKGARLRRVIDRNTKTVERVHRAVAGFILDVLGRIDRLQRPVGRVRKLQDRSISATYDLVRGIENEVVSLVRQPRSRKRRPAKKARAVRGRKAVTAAPISEVAARAS